MRQNSFNKHGNTQAWVFLRPFVLFLSLAILSGCGFHLKGMHQVGALTIKSVKLSNTQGVRPDILQNLQRQLQASGVMVVDLLADAEVELQLQPTGYQASRTSITGQGDTASELLKMSQAVKAVQVANEKPILEVTVTTLRDHRVDTAAALASDRELKTIQKQMALDIAMQIIDRLSRAQNKVVPSSTILETSPKAVNPR